MEGDKRDNAKNKKEDTADVLDNSLIESLDFPFDSSSIVEAPFVLEEPVYATDTTETPANAVEKERLNKWKRNNDIVFDILPKPRKYLILNDGKFG